MARAESHEDAPKRKDYTRPATLLIAGALCAAFWAAAAEVILNAVRR